jgi:REP element-mobilizing transposase RayT
MLIDASWEDELYKYITGIITHKGQKLLAINGMPDHTHILIGMKPTCCLSNLVMEVKKSTNGFINDNRLSKEKFYWQAGFSAFSYSHGALNNIIRYIENQKDHHKKKLFMKEYLEFLDKFEIEYNEKYLFD